jgi:hypothetical protein
MKYFGFFKGMKYGKCEDDFESYETIKNQIDKSEVLAYLKGLPIAGVAPMSVEDIFTREPIEQAGIVEDGDFTFPLDFIHYYEKYEIGIPIEYENYIKTKNKAS